MAAPPGFKDGPWKFPLAYGAITEIWRKHQQDAELLALWPALPRLEKECIAAAIYIYISKRLLLYIFIYIYDFYRFNHWLFCLYNIFKLYLETTFVGDIIKRPDSPRRRCSEKSTQMCRSYKFWTGKGTRVSGDFHPKPWPCQLFQIQNF